MIPLNPTPSRIRQEFPNDSWNAFTVKGLREGWDKVFGTNPSGKNLKDFGNTGQVSNVSTMSVLYLTHNSVRLRGSVSWNVPTTAPNRRIRFRYGIVGQGLTSTSWITASGSTSVFFEDIGGLTPNTDYAFLVQAHNGYHIQNPISSSSSNFKTLVEPQPCNAPSITGLFMSNFGLTYALTWTAASGGAGGTHKFQRAINGTWGTVGDLGPSPFEQNRATNDAHTVQYRIWKDCGGGNVSATVTSSIFNVEAGGNQ